MTRNANTLSVEPPKIADGKTPSQTENAVSPTESYGKGGVIDVDRRPLAVRLGVSPKSFCRQTATDRQGMNHVLRGRHLNMMALGTSIGAGLFVASGQALFLNGPLNLLLGFLLIGVMMFNVIHSLGELTVMFPVSGGFYAHANRFISPSWGFAMGWNYVLQWATVLPMELVVATLTMSFWDHGIPLSLLITIFLFVIIVVNIFGVAGYGEEEFFASGIKLVTLFAFMVTGVVLICGGGPVEPYNHFWGGRTWVDPGPMKRGFRGFIGTLLTAALSYAGTEIVGLAAAESKNPVITLPKAIKLVFWRIFFFYLGSLLIVGLVVSSDNERLIGLTGTGRRPSPFVIALEQAGLPAFAAFVNVVIVISVISIGNSGVYGGSRTITALAQQGYAPSVFSYIDRAGRPLASTVLLILFGPIAYLAEASAASDVFNWLMALSGISVLFTWGSICVAHIRMRQAWKLAGHSLDEIPFKARFGIMGSWFSLFLIVCVFVAQFYIAVSPSYVPASAKAFFMDYLAVFLVFFIWLGGWLWKREGWIKLGDIDIDTGRRGELSLSDTELTSGIWDRLTSSFSRLFHS